MTTRHLWILALALALLSACGKSSSDRDKAPASSAPTATAPTQASAQPAQPAAAATPQPRDDGAKQLLASGTTCEHRQGLFPLDCPEYKAIGQYAFQKQSSQAVAETCAAFLADPDLAKRLLAAACLEKLNARTVTTQLAAALDAIERETDDVVRERIAWGIKHAEAVTANLADRVLALSGKLTENPKHETAASHVFDTLFPQYLAGSGPKPPPAAQARALDALTRDDTPLQRTAFNAVRLLEDKPAACSALAKAIRPDAKRWAEAGEALAAVGEPCAAEVPRVIELALDRAKAGELQISVLRSLDRAFALDNATRKKIVATLRGAKVKAPEWKRKSIDEATAQLTAPRAAK